MAQDADVKKPAERALTDQERVRRDKLSALRAAGLDPFAVERVDRTHDAAGFKAGFGALDERGLEGAAPVVMAGRVMALRQMFAVLADQTGKTQLFFDRTAGDEGSLRLWKSLDIGDVVEAKGAPMRTRTGELTLRVASFRTVAKALRPLPEKWAGLVDEEERARRRHVDLIVSPSSAAVFAARSRVLSLLREHMDSRGYVEVETPILQDVLGGAAARPFVTRHNALDRDFYLRIATELHLKRCVVGGIERVYEIGRIFRNEGMDATHNPEFTTMEAYAAYQDLGDMMELIESGVRFIADSLGATKAKAFGHDVDLSAPFRRVSMVDLIKERTGVDFAKVDGDEQAVSLARQHGVELLAHQRGFGHVVNLFFEHFCERGCVEPTFVTGHPVAISPFAKKDPADPRFARRFELFIGGREIANAFSELNDPIEQRARFADQLRLRALGDEEANEMDEAFLEALEHGMPPTGGIGVGVDRLVMVLTGRATIRDVLLFPHMRRR